MSERLSELLKAEGLMESEAGNLADRLAPWVLFREQGRVLRETEVLRGGSVLYRAPAGAGKSVVGEAALIRSVLRGEMAMWLVSTRALARERAAVLSEALGPAGFRVAATSRDDRYADEDIRSGRVDVAVAVYEKAQALLLQSPALRRAVRLVVADEVHLAEDPERGPAIELLLTLWRRAEAPPQMVGLTAAMASVECFSHRHCLQLFISRERPEPLRQGDIVLETGEARWRPSAEEPAKTWKLPLTVAPDEDLAPYLAELTGRFEKPVLIFVPSRREAKRYAEELARQLPGADANGRTPCIQPPEEDRTEAAGSLRTLLPHRVAWHSAELTGPQRRLVEEQLRTGAIDVCISTGTLAEGINVGARTVLVIPPRTNRGGGWPLENLFGRAGRPGTGAGAGYLLLRRSAERARRNGRPLVPGPPSEDQLLRAVAVAVSAMEGPFEEELRAVLQGVPALAPFTEEGVARGERCGLWQADAAGKLTLSPAGEILALGGAGVEAVRGWRTMLRRFPEGGGEAANVFLALGGGNLCGSIPVALEEAEAGVWLCRLGEEFAGDDSPMAEYFGEFLRVREPRARRMHQAAKGTLLYLERSRGVALHELESTFGVPAGLVEEHCAAFACAIAQLQRLARLLGRDLAVPAEPVPDVEAAPPPGKEPAVELVLRRGTTGTVLANRKPINLTRLQFRLLELLARNAGEGVPYERLERYVWPDAHVERQQVSYVRRKVERALREATGRETMFIETHPSWGLRLALDRAAIRIEEAAPTEALLRSPGRVPAVNSVARLVWV